MPYYAIGFAILVAPLLSNLTGQINVDSKKYKRWVLAAQLFLVASFVFSIYTIAFIPKRDREMLHDVYCTGEIIKNGSIISIPDKMNDAWSLRAYYIRYFFISLDASPAQHAYFLLDKTLDPKIIPVGYSLVSMPTQKFDLYIKKP